MVGAGEAMEPGTAARSAAGSPKATGVWSGGTVTTVAAVVEVDSTPLWAVVDVVPTLAAGLLPLPEHAAPADITAASVMRERSVLGFTTWNFGGRAPFPFGRGGDRGDVPTYSARHRHLDTVVAFDLAPLLGVP